jgi:type II secretory pathway pseudopilin PulG
VLVLAILALLMAAAAPTLRGWSKGGKVRDAIDQVLTATRFAQAQAIHEATTYRIAVNPVDGALELWRLDGETATPASGEFHDPVALPPGFRVRIQRLDGVANPAVEFYPDGRVTPGRIELLAPWDEQTIIEARTPAQRFQLLPAGGVQ